MEDLLAALDDVSLNRNLAAWILVVEILLVVLCIGVAILL